MAEQEKRQGLFSEHASSVAFVVESLLLLAALIAAMAVFTQLFAGSISQANESKREVNAVMAAQNAAERFCSDPASSAAGASGTVAVSGDEKTSTSNVTQDGEDFTVTCEVSSSERKAGTMYQAHIIVSDDAGIAYELDTTRYVSEVG